MSTPRLKVAGLFAGIGGFELGFARAGHQTSLLVDNSEAAQAVLKTHFPDAALAADIREVDRLPDGVEVVCAGFPCQDLSSVGQKVGISGTRSSLVGEVFRLLRADPVPWLVLENVPFILQLGKGGAIKLITEVLRELGYDWAYRVVDSQAFGLPQRRRRWYLVASNIHDPRAVLLSGDVAPDPPVDPEPACGFYWTEGMRALGWAVDAVPPIKGGSSVGVPSPPAIVLANGDVVTPDIRDAERLQGFDAGWTEPAEEVVRSGFRWQLVGNAVSVNAVEWLGRRLVNPEPYDSVADVPVTQGRWPYAAWSGAHGSAHASAAGTAPIWLPRPPLADFLAYPVRPLSARAASGFLRRTSRGSLRFPEGFLDTIRAHIERQGAAGMIAA